MTASRLTTPSPYSAPPSKQKIADLLTEARDRTLLLISGLSDEDLHQQHDPLMSPIIDRKSTRLNSSHTVISYAVFCLKKKKKKNNYIKNTNIRNNKNT